MNWANVATCSRIALIPVVIIIYQSSLEWSHLLAAMVFGIASFTDWLDGYLARKLNQSSAFGAFFDPVADKLLVALVLISLVGSYPVIALATTVIIAREILVSALREWMASLGLRSTVAVAFTGKLKTTVQMISISAILLYEPGMPEYVWQIGYWLLNVAALLSLWSMYQYFRKAWDTLSTADAD